MPEAQQATEANPKPAPADPAPAPSSDAPQAAAAASPQAGGPAVEPPKTPPPPTEDQKLGATGARVCFRTAAGHSALAGQNGGNLHAAMITALRDDWSADLTVFPNGRACWHAEAVPMARDLASLNDLPEGCFTPYH